MDSPRFTLRSLSFSSIPFYLFFIVAGLSILLTYRLYWVSGSNPFPRKPEDFKSAPKIFSHIDQLKMITLKDPKNMAVWTDLAVDYFQLGPDHYVEALEALERAKEAGSLDSRLFYYAGIMYESKGFPDYARPEYERFLQHYPHDSEVRMRLANLYYRLNDLDAALENYEQLYEDNPLDPLLSLNLALTYRDKQRPEDALNVLMNLVKNGQTLSGTACKLFGDLKAQKEDWNGAAEYYQKAIDQKPDDIAALEAMALIQDRLNNPEQALSLWQKVVSINPKHKEAPRMVSKLKKRLRSLKKK
ncbi:MAG TPA: tetratricopeptide repeat protein [Elusimicrobiota bacterium]|nr:tetratricopeptide repeat protein [Elusimicrobiota bacterium]